MFWSANFIVVKEVKFLLKEENLTLDRVLEADDILQECKADNQALIWYLTQPHIMWQLVSLITSEPPADLPLTEQYQHASVACEVLTSDLSNLRDRLSADTDLMDRLCDFVNTETPLNPLLASYFSKTVGTLLEKCPKQDFYLYHIVCLRVLDFFKARREFLPNLLRHLATSAIADTFKHFIRLDDLFKDVIIEWLEEHAVLDALVQIICGVYEPEPLPSDAPVPLEEEDPDTDERGEPVPATAPAAVDEDSEAAAAAAAGRRQARLRAVAAANAAALLIDVVLGEPAVQRSLTAFTLAARLRSPRLVGMLLSGMFTSAAPHRPAALRHGAALLLALLRPEDRGEQADEEVDRGAEVPLAVAPHLPLLHQALLQPPPPTHLPPTLPPPPPTTHCEGSTVDGSAAGDGAATTATTAGVGAGVGAARVQTAALLAQLAASDVQEVHTTMITLGTPALLVQMLFQYPDNNFLHAQVAAFLRNAFTNYEFRFLYYQHLLVECDLLTKLMDAFEHNEHKLAGEPRRGYMGHVIEILRDVARHCPALLEPPSPHLPADHGIWKFFPKLDQQPAEWDARDAVAGLPDGVRHRWAHFCADTLPSVIARHNRPLGGIHPSEHMYEPENLAETLEDNYGLGDMATTDLEDLEETGEELGEPDEARQQRAKQMFEFVKQSILKSTSDIKLTWDDCDADDDNDDHAHSEILDLASPWEPAGGSEGDRGADGDGGEGWAQFGAQFAPPADPFAPAPAPAPSPAPAPAPAPEQTDVWSYGWSDAAAHETSEAAEGAAEGAESEPGSAAEAARGLAALRLAGAAGSAELASNLLAAMSHMPPHLLADLALDRLTAPDNTVDTFSDFLTANANGPAKSHPHLPQDESTPLATDQDRDADVTQASPASTEATPPSPPAER